MSRLSLSHDDAGFNSRWYCEKVTISLQPSSSVSTADEHTWVVEIGKWFDKKSQTLSQDFDDIRLVTPSL